MLNPLFNYESLNCEKYYCRIVLTINNPPFNNNTTCSWAMETCRQGDWHLCFSLVDALAKSDVMFPLCYNSA